MAKKKSVPPNDATAAAEWVPHASLKPWKKNPRINDDVVPRIAASLIRFGWGRALVARAANRELCVGHTSWKAAASLAAELKKDEKLPIAERRAWHPEALRTARTGMVPCRLKEMTAEESHALAKIDNRTNEFAAWNNEELLAQLRELPAPDAALLGWDENDIKLIERQLAGDAFGGGANGSIVDSYGEPPFSVLDTRSARWQERKRVWLALGIQSEVGRGENLLKFSDSMLAVSNGASSKKKKKTNVMAGGLAYGEITHPDGRPRSINGTSVFDPVLTELAYDWFVPEGGCIVDPFAGGSVRGIVAAALGRLYRGIELRDDQVVANRQQWKDIAPKLKRPLEPSWQVGEALETLRSFKDATADFIFSCPPYMDLEKYSDDPRDLSTLKPDAFAEAYTAIIKEAVRVLREDRFACFVVSEVRGPKPGFYRCLPALTIQAFEAAGARYYNEAILINSASSLPLRVRKQFDASRKLGRMHQNILLFCKGNPEAATKALGKVTRALWADEAPAADEPPPESASRESVARAAGGSVL